VAHGLLEVARKRMDSATSELAKLASKRKIYQDKKKRHHDFLTGNLGDSKHMKAKLMIADTQSTY